MKGMFLKIFYIYSSKWATMAQKFQLSMTKLGANDEIRWNDGISCTLIKAIQPYTFRRF